MRYSKSTSEITALEPSSTIFRANLFSTLTRFVTDSFKINK
ncbi:hypothetical protein QIE_0527 [Clostridioides difficile DA00062]|nr:hypothetical protein [Clostridioides difficile]EQG23490.1 hypothetical protein QIE_0527 [Clostridioides difficile DA00062]